MKMPDDYQIPDDPDTGRMDAAYLRTCLGLRAKEGEEPPPLPAAVRQAHFVMAHFLSRLGARGRNMTPTQLATVLMSSGLQPQEPEKPKYSFLDKVPVDGQKVVIHWRKKDQPAHFLGVTPEKRVRVLHNGNEVKMRSDLVRHAFDGEFPDISSNINLVEK